MKNLGSLLDGEAFELNYGDCPGRYVKINHDNLDIGPELYYNCFNLFTLEIVSMDHELLVKPINIKPVRNSVNSDWKSNTLTYEVEEVYHD